MSSKLTESGIEKLTSGLLEKSVYHQIYALSIALDNKTPESRSFKEMLLSERLKSAVGRITQNKTKTSDTKDNQRMNSKQIRTLEKLRDTLLPKLMSGEVGVKLEQREASI